VNFQFDLYVGSVWATFTRDGNLFVGGGVNLNVPNPTGYGASVSVGWLDSATIAPGQTNSFANGYAGGAAGAYGIVGGGKVWSPGNGTATVIGVGVGVKLGKITNVGVGNFGYSKDMGKTGLAW
jgi:filamentous hemagglutinin